MQQLKDLCALRGISGREDAVRAYILQALGSSAETKVDALGNLLVYKRGQQRAKNTVLLAAHMDEVGLIVTDIDSDGLLHFAAVGGVNVSVLVGRSVLVGDKAVAGVIGIKPVHFLSEEERKKLPKIDSLTIDIGAASREEAQAVVRPGDMATFAGDYTAFGDGYICAKALDDRAGCAVLLELLRAQLDYDVVAAFTVQEEIGSAAAAVAFAVDPAYAIVVETTTAADLPGVQDEKRVCALKNGAVVPFMDRGTIYPRALYDTAFAVANREGIAIQTKTQVAGGTDAAVIHKSRAGIKTLTVSLPCRYLHSPSCVIAQEDYHAVKQLVTALSQELAG